MRKGLCRDCNSNDLILTAEGVQCSNCLQLTEGGSHVDEIERVEKTHVVLHIDCATAEVTSNGVILSFDDLCEWVREDEGSILALLRAAWNEHETMLASSIDKPELDRICRDVCGIWAGLAPDRCAFARVRDYPCPCECHGQGESPGDPVQGG